MTSIEQTIVQAELAYAKARLAWLVEHPWSSDPGEGDMLSDRIADLQSRALSTELTA